MNAQRIGAMSRSEGGNGLGQGPPDVPTIGIRQRQRIASHVGRRKPFWLDLGGLKLYVTRTGWLSPSVFTPDGDVSHIKNLVLELKESAGGKRLSRVR